MNFVIEAAGLTVAGGKELALDLMTHLAAHAEHQFTFIVPDLRAYKAITGVNVRTVVCPPGSGLAHRARLLNSQVPRICRDARADALLCLGNFAPWRRVCPTAVLLQNAWIVYHDGVAESRRTLREHLITAYGRAAYRFLGRDVTVITQTPVMKHHLCRTYDVDAARVAIIPNTLALAKLGGAAIAPGAGTEATRPFTFLCLAHCYAHKNIEVLADAVRALPHLTRRPAKCLITIAPEQHPRALRLIESLSHAALAGKIENLGPVSSDMLPRVYGSADALIFPTLLESFSRTYLEAFHFALPIVTSDRDFARHLCRDAALYFDPLNAASVARAMAQVMDDAGLRAALVENGRRILAQAPTWEAIAEQFVAVMERVACGGSRKGGGWQKAEGSGQVWGRDRAPLTPGLSPARAARSSGNPAARKGGATAPADGPSAAYSPLPTAYFFEPTDNSLRPTPDTQLPPSAVRALFNQKARRWRSKYGPKGTLNSRVEQFTTRLAEHCLPPAHILDFGCGTGEIAAAMARIGYRVTACDLAEEMIAIARRSHVGKPIDWVCLEAARTALPFPSASFDGIVASSVFEYLDDVHATAAELARVLHPEGVMLLTVPNPHHPVRKVEARLHHLAAAIARVPGLDEYGVYLRLSRNRFDEEGWDDILAIAQFAPVDARDISGEAWRRQAAAPLVLLALKRVALPAQRDASLYCESLS